MTVIVSNFIGGGNQEYTEKTTELPQATDKTFSHKMFLARDRNKTPNLSGDSH